MTISVRTFSIMSNNSTNKLSKSSPCSNFFLGNMKGRDRVAVRSTIAFFQLSVISYQLSAFDSSVISFLWLTFLSVKFMLLKYQSYQWGDNSRIWVWVYLCASFPLWIIIAQINLKSRTLLKFFFWEIWKGAERERSRSGA